ncbi:MAG: caspase domain-containing protein [Bacteroidota bacterium]
MKTIAFVIGNNDYFEGAQLKCAVNDATAMAEAFHRLGYDVRKELNIRSEDCSRILTDFENQIKEYDASIFYFAGHGYELEGENYLVPIDCQLPLYQRHEANRTCLRLSEILGILKKVAGKVNIVIIDACRKSFDRGTSSAFAQVQAPKGTLIAFSTSPNEGAKDGNGQDSHSVYTSALLQYIGRETLSVESLFKKVRKTVYNLTNGTQTPWEHTSLIGDFFFNTGQLVYSVEIPYDEVVVKDSLFEGGDFFGNLILELRSCNWYRQNSAMEKIRRIPASDLNKNQQFILGRNLYQASGYAWEVQHFFEDFGNNLSKYNTDGENHVLNGILFEIYFDSKGDFRNEQKKHNFNRVFSLRKNPIFAKSFDFIRDVLHPYKEQLFYIPTIQDEPIDIDITAEESNQTPFGKGTIQIIHKVNVGDKDITKQFSRRCTGGINELGVKSCLSNFLTAPQDLIQIHSNVSLQKIAFAQELFDEDWI